MYRVALKAVVRERTLIHLAQARGTLSRVCGGCVLSQVRYPCSHPAWMRCGRPSLRSGAAAQGYLAHKKALHPGTYSRFMSRALWWSLGGVAVSCPCSAKGPGKPRHFHVSYFYERGTPASSVATFPQVARSVLRPWLLPPDPLQLAYRGALLIRNRHSLSHHYRALGKFVLKVASGGLFLTSEVPL